MIKANEEVKPQGVKRFIFGKKKPKTPLISETQFISILEG